MLAHTFQSGPSEYHSACTHPEHSKVSARRADRVVGPLMSLFVDYSIDPISVGMCTLPEAQVLFELYVCPHCCPLRACRRLPEPALPLCPPHSSRR
jgi:hypothetical protein